ncbi:hypothetical protein [Nocardia sienata]|uniref:hypothetical protein n=1 Tax=Nocardia sienata TaxID=248552 RepID=UPI000A4D7686|nr:hypothetical protein [Nocardia sienata]
MSTPRRADANIPATVTVCGPRRLLNSHEVIADGAIPRWRAQGLYRDEYRSSAPHGRAGSADHMPGAALSAAHTRV